MRPEALAAMLPFYEGRFGNPSGSHRVSRDARKAVDEARDVVAAAVGSKPSEVVFTGCGTEADNAAIVGTLERRGGIAVCSAAEHHAVLHVVEHRAGRVVGVDSVGAIDLDQLADALDDTVTVVSVMAVNNEIGTITPLAEVARIVRAKAPAAVLHTDAIQAACWLDLRDVYANTDLVSLSAHKFGGPKGAGVLIVKEGTTLAPLLEGGGQEHDRRSGTHNVAGIVALAEALRLTDAHRTEEMARVTALRDRLVDGLIAEVPGTHETVPRQQKVAGSAHVCFEGIESEALLFLLDEAGVCASAASACSSGAIQTSHVLAAMQVPPERAGGALRMSLGFASSDEDVDRALEVLPPAVARLRRLLVP